MVFCVHFGPRVENLKCELLFVSAGGRGFQVKLILFVSLGFCELLRWPLIIESQALRAHALTSVKFSTFTKVFIAFL